jgi:hypothetical protein
MRVLLPDGDELPLLVVAAPVVVLDDVGVVVGGGALDFEGLLLWRLMKRTFTMTQPARTAAAPAPITRQRRHRRDVNGGSARVFMVHSFGLRSLMRPGVAKWRNVLEDIDVIANILR